ncbi:MAG TPA: WecB/TagA/CpsF family glycosyltransferase [Ignavibacteria bacterium]
MKKYFNINYEFDQNKVDEIILDHIANQKPGYVCSLDGNHLAIANTNPDHLRVINDAIVNNCDSTWVPVFINWIYGTKFTNYCGMDLFVKYIRLKKFRQFFLGSTPEVLHRLQENLSKIDPKINNMRFETLPFISVEEFDYEQIGEIINGDEPDIIWVSLGAPKQEKFMSLLLPYLKKGVMFGFGAIFNFCGEMPGLKRAPQFMVKLKLEWLYRLYQELRKQISRISLLLSLLPKMVIEELKNKNKKRLFL